MAFVDGQNLFYAAKEAFGATHPDYDPQALGRAVCAVRGWSLERTYLYTGVPRFEDNPYWHQFWTAKLAALKSAGVVCYGRALRYTTQPPEQEGGRRRAREKGIDVRIALDVLSLAYEKVYDVALVFSQDQDLSELGGRLKRVAGQQQRAIQFASAFPSGPATSNPRGISRSLWIPIDQATYDACVDPHDYRPKSAR